MMVATFVDFLSIVNFGVVVWGSFPSVCLSVTCRLPRPLSQILPSCSSLSWDHMAPPVTEEDKALTHQATAADKPCTGICVGSCYLGSSLSCHSAARSLSQPCDSWEAQSNSWVYCRQVKYLSRLWLMARESDWGEGALSNQNLGCLGLPEVLGSTLLQ